MDYVNYVVSLSLSLPFPLSPSTCVSLLLSLSLFPSRRGQPEILAPLLLMAADPSLVWIWARSELSNNGALSIRIWFLQRGL